MFVGEVEAGSINYIFEKCDSIIWTTDGRLEGIFLVCAEMSIFVIWLKQQTEENWEWSKGVKGERCKGVTGESKKIKG